MKKLLVDIWNCLFDCYLTVRNSLYLFMDIPYRKVVIAPHVVSIEETIRYIIQSHCSVSRLGDGEIKIANGKALAFQTQQPLLQQKMQEVLSVPISNHIVCLPDNIYRLKPLQYRSAQPLETSFGILQEIVVQVYQS